MKNLGVMLKNIPRTELRFLQCFSIWTVGLQFLKQLAPFNQTKGREF